MPDYEIKGFSFSNLFIFNTFLYKLCICIIGITEKIAEERGTDCSQWDASELLQNVPSKLDTEIKQETQT
jgi:hypothetical protein